MGALVPDTILIVADDEHGEEIGMLVSDLGHDPVLATDSREAVDLIDTTRIDALLVLKAGMNVAELAEAARMFDPVTPVICAAGYIGEGEHHCDAFVREPVQPA